MSHPKISHLLIDFDETLTQTDTIASLAHTAYYLHTTSPNSRSIPLWSFFTNSYITPYTTHKRLFGPRNNISAETTYLNSLKPIEKASIERMEMYGVFRELEIEDLKAAAREVPLKPGWWRTVKKVLRRGGGVSIVSSNWSRVWIREALLAGVRRDRDKGDGGGDEEEFNKISIHCNDLVLDETGSVTTGQFSRYFEEADEGIWTAGDKLVVAKRIAFPPSTSPSPCPSTSSTSPPPPPPPSSDGPKAPIVYIGDSSTDLLCLLYADVGIVVGSKLDNTCSRIGVKLVEGLEGIELSDTTVAAGGDCYDDDDDGGGGGGGSERPLRKVKDWAEIEGWISELYNDDVAV